MYKLNYMLPVLIGAPDMADTKIFNISLIQKGEPKLLRLFPNYSSSSNSHKPQLSPMIKYTKQSLGSYLAGLIEGDGYITITNKDSVILGITFNLKDKPLAEKLLRILGGGFIVKRKTNSVELRFSHKQTLCQIIELINGKFRTPKIDQLYKLVDWMNKKHSMNITKLPLNDSPILKDSWLSGFIDAGGCFYIRNSLKQIICKFNLEQRMIYPKTNENYNTILNKICLAFGVKLNIRERISKKNSYYIIKLENQNAVKLLINYLDAYPLLSSKHLDFLSWKIVFKEILNKNHMTIEGRQIVSLHKSQMNNSRTSFNWDHLKKIKCRLF